MVASIYAMRLIANSVAPEIRRRRRCCDPPLVGDPVAPDTGMHRQKEARKTPGVQVPELDQPSMAVGAGRGSRKTRLFRNSSEPSE
jgi:hypothetical protein